MGTPREIYYQPSDEFVADFIGEANFINGRIKEIKGDNCLMEIAGHTLTLPNPKKHPVGSSCRMVARPEAVLIGKEGVLPCRVTLSCFMGAYHFYHVMLEDTLIKITDYCPVNKHTFQAGDEAWLHFEDNCVHIL